MSINKVIKYCAIGFAIFLIGNIIFAISSLLIGFSYMFSDNKDVIGKMETISNEEISKNLDIDLSAGVITIEIGNKFEVVTNNKTVTVQNKNNKTYIKDKDFNFNINSKDNHSRILISVPENFSFDNMDINLGFGELKIYYMNMDNLDADVGAGDIQINSTNIKANTDIEMGAGDIKVFESDMYNLSLDIGAGSASYSSRLNGINKFSIGTGSLDLNLDSKENYKLKFENNIGNIKIDNKKFKESTYGIGENIIKFNGLISNGNINFE